MHVRHWRGLPSRIPAAVAALLMLAMALPAAALSLGAPETLSSLGEPLHLEVAIESDHSAGGLPVARLINADGTATANVPGIASGSIQLEIVALDQIHQRLQIRSSLPVWEPMLTLRVEVSQASMRVVREIPVLLDPPAAGDPVASGIAGAPDAGDVGNAIDVRSALAAPVPPPPTATLQPTAPVAERARPAAARTKAAAPADFTLPAPRFQLAAALSTYSLAWLQNHPQPATSQAGSGAETDAEVTTSTDDETDDEESAPTPAEETLAKTAAPIGGGRKAAEATAPPRPLASPSQPRGLPLGSPWRVFLIMTAVAIGLFVYARRLRQTMMSDKALTA